MDLKKPVTAVILAAGAIGLIAGVMSIGEGSRNRQYCRAIFADNGHDSSVDGLYEGKDALTKLKFTVSALKQDYICGEPVTAVATLKNENDFAVKVTGYEPRIAEISGNLSFYFKVPGNDEWRWVGGATPGIRLGETTLPSFVLHPGSSVAVSDIYYQWVKKPLQTGVFKVKAEYSDKVGNTVQAVDEYNVKEPEGNDRSAWEFIQKLEKERGALFDGIPAPPIVMGYIDLSRAVNEMEVELLERFLVSYPCSTYSYYVGFRLGLSYMRGFYFVDEQGKTITSGKPSKDNIDCWKAAGYFRKALAIQGDFPYRPDALLHIAECYTEIREWDVAFLYIDELREVCRGEELLNKAKSLEKRIDAEIAKAEREAKEKAEKEAAEAKKEAPAE